MPSQKKRINLTVPDNIYEEIQKYKAEFGLFNDATTCLQLIVQQLRAYENGKRMSELIRNTPIETLQQISNEGFSFVKEGNGSNQNPSDK